MTRTDRPISVLAFDEHAISWIRIRPSATGIVIADAAVRKAPGPGAWSIEEGSMDRVLDEFVRLHGVASDSVYTVVPRHEMTARIVELPSQEPAEIASMVRLSAEEYVPFPVQDLYIDQAVLRKTSDGGACVLAVFAHRDVVETHLRLLRSAGVVPEQIYLSTACLAAALAGVTSPSTDCSAILNLASGGLEFLVLDKGQLAYGRAVAVQEPWNDDPARADRPSSGVLDSETPIEELADEIRMSVSAYRRDVEDAAEVSGLYVNSEVVSPSPYSEGLAEALAIPCRALPFGKGVVQEAGEPFETVPLTLVGAALTALGRAPFAIRLLPETVRKAKQAAGAKKSALRVGSVAAAFLVSLLLYYGQATWHRAAYIRQLEAQTARLASQAEGIAAKERQLKLLQEQVDAKDGPLELLAGLCDVFPASGMNVARYTYRRGERLDLFGRALAFDSVAQFIKDLNKQTTHARFARAQSLYENQVWERDKQVFEFKVTVPLVSEKASDDGTESTDDDAKETTNE